MLKLNKKSVRIISVIMLAIVLFMSMGNVVFAAFDASMQDPGGEAGNLANKILGILTWVGVAVSIGMLIFLGIKYVTSSPDGKADLKKQLGVYVLGFVLIISATTIVGILANAVKPGTSI